MNRFDTFLHTTPAVTPLPDFAPCNRVDGENEWAHIEAIAYEGALYNGKKTKVFAYIGFPETTEKKPVPAMVLVHGGGGHAFAEWVKMWNDRGYAAIAMDNTGFFPSKEWIESTDGEIDPKSQWHHGLWGDLAEDGYTDAPTNDEMKTAEEPLTEQWMYHAVASTILAHNILLADERVDSDRIGITGISWGGVIASLAIGFDTRYAFAIPVYGSGYLEQTHGWIKNCFSHELTRKNWSAADRFDRVKIPVFWVCFPDDLAFSVNSNSRSYEDTKNAGAVFLMLQNMEHDHMWGWAPPEIMHFADSVVKGAPSFTRCVTEPEGKSFSFTVEPAADATAVTARIAYITAPLSYSKKEGMFIPSIDQKWQFAPCDVSDNTVHGTLPDEAVNYYVELSTVTPRGTLLTTTRFVEKI